MVNKLVVCGSVAVALLVGACSPVRRVPATPTWTCEQMPDGTMLPQGCAKPDSIPAED